MRTNAKRKTNALARRRTTAIVRREPLTVAEAIEKVMIQGDLTPLSPEQRLQYYKTVCRSLGLNPLTRPFDYIAFQESDNAPPRMALYARRDCTDQLRKLHGISVTKITRSVEDGMLVAECEVKDRDGNTDSSIGVVPTTKWNKWKKPQPGIEELTGRELANARMKAETKAKRRATLSICGLGFLDVSELDQVESYSEVTPAGRVIREVKQDGSAEAAQAVATKKLEAHKNGKAIDMPTEPEPDKKEIIQLIEWKEGLIALAGDALNIVRSEMTPEEKALFTFKYDGQGKCFTIPASQANNFAALCEKHGVDPKWSEKAANQG